MRPMHMSVLRLRMIRVRVRYYKSSLRQVPAGCFWFLLALTSCFACGYCCAPCCCTHSRCQCKTSRKKESPSALFVAVHVRRRTLTAYQGTSRPSGIVDRGRHAENLFGGLEFLQKLKNVSFVGVLSSSIRSYNLTTPNIPTRSHYCTSFDTLLSVNFSSTDAAAAAAL